MVSQAFAYFFFFYGEFFVYRDVFLVGLSDSGSDQTTNYCPKKFEADMMRFHPRLFHLDMLIKLALLFWYWILSCEVGWKLKLKQGIVRSDSCARLCCFKVC